MAPQGVKPGTTAVEVIIREGRKNQVKRMLSKIHHPVIRLHRCNFAGLELKDVAKGSWRELTDREVQILKAGGIPPKQASFKRGSGKPPDTAATCTATTAVTAPRPSATPTASATRARQSAK
ncbi:MAG: hypothetical protein ACLU1W_01710 [Collinsella sp.]